MRTYRIGFSLLVLAFLPLRLCADVPVQSAEAIYQEAVFKETTTRDLESAVGLYKKVLAQPDAGRNLQSNAHLRMGICYRTLGLNDQAKEAWKKVLQDFSDQPSTYQEAKNHLQALSVEEEKIAQVQTSTPTIVYAIPRTRWEFRVPGVGYSSTSGWLLAFPSIAYFYKPNRAVALEGASFAERDIQTENVAFESSGQTYTTTVNIRSAFIAATHHWEKPVGNQLRPYFKLGPAAYRFLAQDSIYNLEEVTKWSPGLFTEAGVTLGWSRGFIFVVGYGLNVYYQPSLLNAVGASIQGAHGLRVALGYRW